MWRVAPYLAPALYEELTLLVAPSLPTHLLRDRYMTMTWLNVLALGRKPQTLVSRSSRRG